MKNLKRSLLISALLLSSFALFANQEGLKEELTINGLITSSEIIVKYERVVIFVNDEVVDVVYSDDKGNFNISLDFDKVYMLVIGEGKYDKRWVKISTKIPVEYRKENHVVRCFIDLNPVKDLTAYVE